MTTHNTPWAGLKYLEDAKDELDTLGPNILLLGLDDPKQLHFILTELFREESATMHAIHHIKRVTAELGQFETSNYMTLVFQGEDLSGSLRTEIVLYFEKPVPGQIAALAEAINRADEIADEAAIMSPGLGQGPEDPCPTTPSGRPYDRDEVR